MNTQRQVIYAERQKILEGADFKDEALDMVEDVVRATIQRVAPPEAFTEEWDLDVVLAGIAEVYPTTMTTADLDEVVHSAELEERVVEEALELYEEKERAVGSETMRELERMVLLNITDTKWREHLYEMDYLQEGIHLRAYAQKDPLTEYRREAYDDVRGAHRLDPRRLRPLHLPRRAGPPGRAGRALGRSGSRRTAATIRSRPRRAPPRRP